MTNTKFPFRYYIQYNAPPPNTLDPLGMKHLLGGLVVLGVMLASAGAAMAGEMLIGGKGRI